MSILIFTSKFLDQKTFTKRPPYALLSFLFRVLVAETLMLADVIMSLKDYYKILELTPGASVADIKKSFRRLALLYHPDRNFGSNIHEAKFKEIKEAYDVLSDTKQRQEYNSRRREQANEQRHSYSHSH